jgi:nucleoside 2-deoxyribosyltransferase
MKARAETILFLSGPYSRDPVACTEAAVAIQAELLAAGWLVFCPHANSHFADVQHRLPPAFYYSMDLEFLRRCDAIVMMPDWIVSNGATLEREHALEHGLPVYYWESVDDRRRLLGDGG